MNGVVHELDLQIVQNARIQERHLILPNRSIPVFRLEDPTNWTPQLDNQCNELDDRLVAIAHELGHRDLYQGFLNERFRYYRDITTSAILIRPIVEIRQIIFPTAVSETAVVFLPQRRQRG